MPTEEELARSKDEAFQLMRRKLKADVYFRVQPLINDCKTFRAVRLRQADWYKSEVERNRTLDGIGGGNFTIALMMMSTLNLLSKVSLLLVDRSRFDSEEDENSDKKTLTAILEDFDKRLEDPALDKEKLDQLRSFRQSIKKRLRSRRRGDCNEQDAFVALIRLLNEQSVVPSLGLTHENAWEVWQRFRNKLAHVAGPTIESQIGVDIINSNVEIDSDEGEGKFYDGPTFVKTHGIYWHCHADRLVEDVEKILLWVVKRIEAETDFETIQETLIWMNQQIGFKPPSVPT